MRNNVMHENVQKIDHLKLMKQIGFAVWKVVIVEGLTKPCS